MSRSAILLALCGAALCLLFALLLHRFDLVREPVERWSEAADNDRYLALKRLAEKRGATLDVRSRFFQPEEPQTLLMLGGRMDLTRVEHDALIEWVKSGGHLVTVPFDNDLDRMGAENDPLLDLFDVRVIRDTSTRDSARPRGQSQEHTLTLPDGKILIAPSMLSNWTLNHYSAAPQWRAFDNAGDRIVRYSLGEGQVTLTMQPRYLINQWLDKVDHGALAVVTLELQEDTVVTVLRTYASGGLAAWLYRHALAFLIALAVLVVVWIWRQSIRFGPILPDPMPARQSLAEHIRATGRWLWRKGAHAALYAACREAFERHLATRLPGLSALSRQERAQRIADRAGVSLVVAEQVLDTSATPDPRAFTERVRTLEAVRARL
jgi:Domain of unknown function (DUF4350)